MKGMWKNKFCIFLKLGIENTFTFLVYLREAKGTAMSRLPNHVSYMVACVLNA